jgi:hypothetical protein
MQAGPRARSGFLLARAMNHGARIQVCDLFMRRDPMISHDQRDY